MSLECKKHVEEISGGNLVARNIHLLNNNIIELEIPKRTQYAGFCKKCNNAFMIKSVEKEMRNLEYYGDGLRCEIIYKCES